MKLFQSYSLSMFRAFKAHLFLLVVLFFVVGFPSSASVFSSTIILDSADSISVVETIVDTNDTKPLEVIDPVIETVKKDNNDTAVSTASSNQDSGGHKEKSVVVETEIESEEINFPPLALLLQNQIPADVSPLWSKKIDDTTFNGPTLNDQDRYGVSIANLGDLDGNGATDVAVGSHRSDVGGLDRGEVFIHFRNLDGSLKSTAVINNSTPGAPVVSDLDIFGVSVANIGDLNGDGVTDIAVGSYGDDVGGNNRGAIYIIFLNTDGSVKSFKKIDDNTANGPELANDDRYGASIANIGDRDGDGKNDIAVGAQFNFASGVDAGGAMFVHFLNTDGSIKSTKTFNNTTPNITPVGMSIDSADYYGLSIADLGDINNDGVRDIAVGAVGDNSMGTSTGAFYIHFMKANNDIASTVKINADTPNGPSLHALDYYGTIANIGDLDGDGTNDVAVGAETFPDLENELDGEINQGIIYIHFLNPDGSIKSSLKIDGTTPGGPVLNNEDYYGTSVANMGDLNGDGKNDIAVGAFWDDAGGVNRGAIYIHYLFSSGGGNTLDAGFTISKTTMSLGENGGTDTATVVLDKQPTSTVVFNIVAASTDDITVSPATLTFTTSNWNIPQMITVTAVNDFVSVNETATVTISVNDALSDDEFDPLADKVITITLINDDSTDNGGGGGGGGNHHRSSSGGSSNDTVGVVLGASTSLSCEVSPYLTKPIKFGANNNPADVRLLEMYLNTYEGANIPVDGMYSQDDFNRVVVWQEKYANEVLKPWGITKGTGYVFMTSLQKIKQIHKAACDLAEVPTQILSCSNPILLPEKTITAGLVNDLESVKLLEKYLNTYEGASLIVDGVYSQADISAVMKWQGVGASGNVLESDLAKIKQKHLARCSLFVTPPEF